MSRLALDIDPIAYIRNFFDSSTPDPAHIAVLSEIGGIESIVCYFRDDLKTVTFVFFKISRARYTPT